MKQNKTHFVILVLFFVMFLPIKVDAYSITINETEHGSVSISQGVSQYNTIDPSNVNAGEAFIETVPDDGYVVNLVSLQKANGDLVSVETYGGRWYRFRMPAENLTATVEFVKTQRLEAPVTQSDDYIDDNKCVFLKGNVNTFGSEVVCGTEHFYVLSNDGEEVRLFSKYNLNVGNSIYRESINKKSNDSRIDKTYCSDLAKKYGAQNRANDYYDQEGYCFYEMNFGLPDVIKQSKNHSSAHFDENDNYLYPQVGDIYLNSGTNPETAQYANVDPNITYSDTSYFDYLVGPETNVLGPILTEYTNTLSNMIGNNEIVDIDLLSLSEIDSLALKYSNQQLPLQEWGDAVKAIPYINEGFIVGRIIYNTDATFGHIDNYIPNDYSWLWSTSYWLSTAFSSGNTYYGKYYMFVAPLGKICGSGFQYCASATALGTGIRPVITIKKGALSYLIKTKTDGNGTIDVVENSLGGEIIQFKINAEKGYVLSKLVVTTDSGEIVEFDEGETIKNADGTFSIDKNKFTMPFENVTIEAKFESENILKNPETGDKLLFMILILVASIGIGTLIYIKKESRYNV